MASARVMVDSAQAAAEALLTVLESARHSKANFEFGPINAESVLRSGLALDGDIEEVLQEVLEVSGAVLTP